jgi:hypothetical protein
VERDLPLQPALTIASLRSLEQELRQTPLQQLKQMALQQHLRNQVPQSVLFEDQHGGCRR